MQVEVYTLVDGSGDVLDHRRVRPYADEIKEAIHKIADDLNEEVSFISVYMHKRKNGKGGLNLDFIAKRRRELQITQVEMSERLGMGGAHDYCRYENGIYKLNAEKIPDLAKALKCPIKELFIGA